MTHDRIEAHRRLIASILRVNPDGPIGRRIVARVMRAL